MRKYILLISIILVSGCVDLGPIFGSDVIKVNEKTTHTGSSDVLIIKDARTLPNPPYLPGDDVTLTVILQNNDELKSAENVKLDLFDAPSFYNAAGLLCNNVGCYPDNDLCSARSGCFLLPGDEKVMDFSLRAPSESDIAGIETKADLNFLVDYDYFGSLVYTLPVVNKEEILRRQRAGETIDLTASKNFGSGPIEIGADLQTQYVLAGQPANLIFTLHNKGAGSIKNSIIKADSASHGVTGINQYIRGVCLPLPLGKVCTDNSDCSAGSRCLGARISRENEQETNYGMNIYFPPGIDLPDYRDGKATNSIFYCSGSAANGWTCTNTEDIPMYRDESRISMRFRIQVSEAEIGTAPFKSYTIISQITYPYELRSGVSVSINPFENG